MPLSSADLTTYHLHNSPRFAVISMGLAPCLALVPVTLIEVVTHNNADGSTLTVPVFEALGVPGGTARNSIDPSAILLEPHELPAVLRDLLWPPVAPPVAAAPVAPVVDFAAAGNINDEPVTTGSSDYSEPV